MTCLGELDRQVRSVRRKREVWTITDTFDTWALAKPLQTSEEGNTKIRCCCGCGQSMWYSPTYRELLEDTE